MAIKTDISTTRCVRRRTSNSVLPLNHRLSIAMMGTRGVPAAYGGFETAVEEVGQRLATRGHRVTVCTRNSEQRIREHLGMDIVHLPALPQKQLETLSHSAPSSLYLILQNRPDVAFFFNAANAPFLPMLRAAHLPTALQMDVLEWKCSNRGGRGQAYYPWVEQFGVRQADALIADAPGIADHYRQQFGVPTNLIRYCAALLDQVPEDGARGLGLEPDGFHLVVARLEPENHVLEIVEGYHRSRAVAPLVVVGSAPYSAEYTRAISQAAEGDPRIRLLGGVYDQDLLDALYFHALTYVHGHSVGDTNPALLRTIGAGTPVIAAKLTLLGTVFDGYEWFEQELRDQAAASNPEVEYVGFHPEIWPLLADADLLLVSSLPDEPFGNTAVEGVLALLPVIARDSSGLRKAASAYSTTRLVRPGDATDIASALSNIAENWMETVESVDASRAEALRCHAPEVYRATIARACGPESLARGSSTAAAVGRRRRAPGPARRGTGRHDNALTS